MVELVENDFVLSTLRVDERPPLLHHPCPSRSGRIFVCTLVYRKRKRTWVACYCGGGWGYEMSLMRCACALVDFVLLMARIPTMGWAWWFVHLAWYWAFCSTSRGSPCREHSLGLLWWVVLVPAIPRRPYRQVCDKSTIGGARMDFIISLDEPVGVAYRWVRSIAHESAITSESVGLDCRICSFEVHSCFVYPRVSFTISFWYLNAS